MLKKEARLRRARKVRANILKLGIARLSVHRTPKHIYAQIISPDGASVLASASTLNTEDRLQSGSTGNIEAAKIIGRKIAEKSIAAGISDVAFDRSGFKYHGRIAALADSARENGLKF